ncbi:hypothetical protein niasHT_038399 [Heterodera trifolii]|uniref:Uncharacterized protein n=1 Tax=Heterodera trifolii TaxID=157864 RepID=A0ABD2HWT9_9BILA
MVAELLTSRFDVRPPTLYDESLLDEKRFGSGKEYEIGHKPVHDLFEKKPKYGCRALDEQIRLCGRRLCTTCHPLLSDE